LFLLGIFANASTLRSRERLLGGDHHLGLAGIFTALVADHPADGFAAFSAVYRGLVMGVNRTRGASARRDGVVHLARIEAPADTDDHASDLQ
jgi:hypothetical protein